MSSVELERAIKTKVDAIDDVAALGISSGQGGPERLVLAVVMKNEQKGTDSVELKQQCQQALNTMLNPLYKVWCPF